MLTNYVKIIEDCSNKVTVWKADWNSDIHIYEKPHYHWYWKLSYADKQLYSHLGEASFLHHKYIISKALKKARNNFTSAL